MDHLIPLSDRQGTATDQQDNMTPSLSSLLGGIVTDLQKLIEEHLELLRLEVQDDFEKSKSALIPLAIGSGLIVAAGLLLLVTLIGILSWLIPSISWFGWAGILAVILTAGGAILMVHGKKKLNRVNPLPEETLQTVKESIQCISNQITTR